MATPNLFPICLTSTLLFLNANEEVRAVTFNPLTLVNALIISSVIPSQK